MLATHPLLNIVIIIHNSDSVIQYNKVIPMNSMSLSCVHASLKDYDFHVYVVVECFKHNL
jgi:hypothetical protein